MGGWKGSSPTPGQSSADLVPTLLGGVREVRSESRAASSGEVSWPNVEKLNSKIVLPIALSLDKKASLAPDHMIK